MPVALRKLWPIWPAFLSGAIAFVPQDSLSVLVPDVWAVLLG